MSAIFWFQSDPGFDEAIRREVIFYPGVKRQTQPTVWKRSTDGSRGKDSAWEVTTLDAVLSVIPVDEGLVRMVALGITPGNAREIIDTGKCASIMTRVQRSTSSTTHGYATLREALLDVHSRIMSSDQSLADLVEGKLHAEIGPILTVVPEAGKQRATRAKDVDPSSLPTPAADPEMVDALIVNVTEASTGSPVPQQVQHVTQTTVVGGRTSRFVPYDGSKLLVPLSVYRRYVGRFIEGREDMDIMDQAYANGWNVMIKGPTGPGKTMFIRAWAARRELMCARLQGDGPFNLAMHVGMRDIDTQGTLWLDGPVSHVARHGGVILVDEINFILAKNLASFYSMFDDERTLRLVDNNGEVIKLHPNTLIAATYNPGYVGTNELNFALKNRFPLTLDWGYDVAVEETLGIKPSVALLAEKMRSKHGITTPTPTNALLEFQKIVDAMGLEFGLYNFLNRYDEEEQAVVSTVLDLVNGNLREDFAVPVSI